eukprot:g20204.t1
MRPVASLAVVERSGERSAGAGRMILKKDNVKCTVDSLHQLAGQAFKHTDEFMCQSWGKDASELYDTGMKLAGLDKEKIVVKVPATVEGIKAAKRLLEEGARAKSASGPLAALGGRRARRRDGVIAD